METNISRPNTPKSRPNTPTTSRNNPEVNSGRSSRGVRQKTPPPLPLYKRHVHPIIEIVNGSKHYGFYRHWKQVLRKFNIAVYGGEIYALLGPQGCGKSSVLHVILGLKTLNSGQVTIFGFKPGHELSGIPGIRVGYTPQSNGLYPDFTIKETLYYYGSLLHLKRQYISQRMAFLGSLLALPHDEQYVKHCTEGTKMQISFAIALLHEPEVLILDEPCTGMDPVLRRSMWEHMKQLAKEDTTILVTTQTCEEARLADRVGFMRHGHLLIDGNPRELVQAYGEKLLQTLYMRIYRSDSPIPLRTVQSIEENPLVKLETLNITTSEGFIYTGDEEGDSSELEIVVEKPEITSTRQARRQLRRCCSCNRRLRVLLLRDLIRTFRNFIWQFLVIILPALFLIVFCGTVGTTPTSLVLGVVNYETTEEDCLTHHDNFISCQVLDLIDPEIIKQEEFHSEEDAWKAAENLEVAAILTIKKEFTLYIHKVLAEVVLGKTDFTVNRPPLTLSLDMSSRIIANTIEYAIKAAIETYLLEATKDTKVEGAAFGYPLKIGIPIYGSERTTDTEYMAPGFIIAFIFHTAAFISSITLVNDIVNKITQRNYLGGVYLKETVLSLLIVYGTIIMIQAVLMFCVLFLIFDVANVGSLWYLALIVLVQIWCGISFGVFIAMIARSCIGATLYIFCGMVVILFLCGINWPLDGQPRWLCMIIEFLPQTKSIEAARTIIQRGTDITHKAVWAGIVVPVVWFIIFTLAYSFKQRRI